MDRNNLYGAIGYYLSALSLPNVTDFVHVLVVSASLWTAPRAHPSDDGLTYAAHPLMTRTTSVAQALAFAVSERIALILKNAEARGPYTAQRDLRDWIDALLVGIDRGSRSSDADALLPRVLLPQLAVLTGVLQGLSSERQERARKHAAQRDDAKEMVPLHLQSHIQRIQLEWVRVLAAMLHTWDEHSAQLRGGAAGRWERQYWRLGGSDDGHAPTDTPGNAALALAAQSADLVPGELLRPVRDELIVGMGVPVLASIYGVYGGDTRALSRLFADAQLDASGKASLAADSRTGRWAQQAQSHPLYALSGPLARLVADAVRRKGLVLGALSFTELVTRGSSGQRGLVPLLADMAQRLDRAWSSSALAGRPTEEIEGSSHATTRQVWQVNKTLLFTVTTLLDAVVECVVERCPSPTTTYPPARDAPAHEGGWPSQPTSNIPDVYLALLRDVLHVFLHLYWITSTFGLDGFESYRKLFYSSLDVLGRDPDACTGTVAQLAQQLGVDRIPDASAEASTSVHAARDASFLERTHVVYFLLVAEQLAAELPDAMVERLLLPVCRPYLEYADPAFQDSFESAHSLVLALYTAGKNCTLSLTPFYVNLLLQSYPQLLTATQLETALCTVVASLSERSDSLTWWTVEQVQDAINAAVLARLPASSEEAGSSRAEGDASGSGVAGGDGPGGDAPVPSMPLREVLALSMAALISRVNLVHFRSLLVKVKALIFAQPEGSPARERIVSRTFEALADLNAATREEGMKWWLEHSPEFTRGA